MSGDAVIEIESTRDRHEMGVACLLRWGAVEKYAPIGEVRATAEDLFTCAAYAEMIGELLRIGLDKRMIGQLTTAMLTGRQPRYFGSPGTVFLLPVGSSTLHVGMVALARRNEFHRGQAEETLSPGEAREMGRAWLTAAEASESDTLVGAVLERRGWLDAGDLDILFGLLREIREGRAQVPPEQE